MTMRSGLRLFLGQEIAGSLAHSTMRGVVGAVSLLLGFSCCGIPFLLQRHTVVVRVSPGCLRRGRSVSSQFGSLAPGFGRLRFSAAPLVHARYVREGFGVLLFCYEVREGHTCLFVLWVRIGVAVGIRGVHLLARLVLALVLMLRSWGTGYRCSCDMRFRRFLVGHALARALVTNCLPFTMSTPKSSLSSSLVIACGRRRTWRIG